nr:hypothetical protein KPHV_01670 [Kitasatospora purpeofusca]
MPGSWMSMDLPSIVCTASAATPVPLPSRSEGAQTVARISRRISVAVAAAAVIGGALLSAPAASATDRAALVGLGPFLQNTNSGKCLGPAGGGGANNTPTVIYNCDSDPSRAWRLAY